MPSNTWKPSAAAVSAADWPDSPEAASDCWLLAAGVPFDCAAADEAAADVADAEDPADAADAAEAEDADDAEDAGALAEALPEPDAELDAAFDDVAEEHPTATTSANAHADAEMTAFKSCVDFMANPFPHW